MSNAWLLLQVSQSQSDCSSALMSWHRLITTLITNSVWSTFWILCWSMKRIGDISSSRKSQCTGCKNLREKLSYREWVLGLLMIVIKKILMNMEELSSPGISQWILFFHGVKWFGILTCLKFNICNDVHWLICYTILKKAPLICAGLLISMRMCYMWLNICCDIFKTLVFLLSTLHYLMKQWCPFFNYFVQTESVVGYQFVLFVSALTHFSFLLFDIGFV